ncbi:MAG: ABC transporter ATP-binding protein [Candidatus Anammoxibacter sp.]
MVDTIKKAQEYLKEILKKPEPVGTKFNYKDILFFARFVKPVWKLGAISLVLMFVTSGLGSLIPLSGKVLIDFIIMKQGFEKVENFLGLIHLSILINPVKHFLGSLNLVIIAAFIIGATIGLIGIVKKYLMLRFQQEITFNLQTTLFDHILRFPLTFFKKRQTGYLMSRVSGDVNAVQQLFSQSISQIATTIFYLFFGMVILFALNAELSIVLVCIIPVYVFINYVFSKRIRSISHNEREKSAFVSKDIQEVISGVELIKSHATEEREVNKVSAVIRDAFRVRMKRMILSSISNSSMKGSQLVLVLVIIWLGTRANLKGTMTIGDFVAFTSYVMYLSNLMNRFSSIYLMLQPVFASLDRLMEMFRIIPEFEHDEKSSRLIKPEKLHGEIKFENVSFSYEKNKPVLRNINLSVHPGETIALVGPSGAGKTTFVNLILKFYVPQSGVISLDGYNMKEIDHKWLREQIGIVSQDIFLFNETIENNIKYGNPLATRADVIAAARKAHIHDDIESFPDKYDTVVGERGATLSAGQKQRVSIARTFLKNPKLLIFDEPTSALDMETESNLKDSMDELIKGRTTFIISHRMTITDIASRIFVFDNGGIVERIKSD